MAVFAQAGNNPAGQNLVWLVNAGGIPLLIALLAAIAFVHWFIWWLMRWSQRLPASGFPVARTDLIRGIIAGVALAAVWLPADFLILWQRQAPFWGRQAWETRCIMTGMSLLLGATLGTAVFRIRRFKRAIAERAG